MAEASGDGLGVVVRVVDGDTIDVTVGGREERVRLIGIDAPESVARDTPDQCFGAEASAALKALLTEGTPVLLERDAETRDRYGRLLAYVHRSDDSLFVNQWLLDGGFADALFFEPNTAFRDEFTEARDRARESGAGLWSVCTGPDQPLDTLGGPASDQGTSR